MEKDLISKEEMEMLRASMNNELMTLIGSLTKTDGNPYDMEKILEPGFNETKRILLEKTLTEKAVQSSKKKPANPAVTK